MMKISESVETWYIQLSERTLTFKTMLASRDPHIEDMSLLSIVAWKRAFTIYVRTNWGSIHVGTYA